jgi:ATP-dependent DNA helicase RecG
MKVMGFVNKFNRGISKVKLEMAANGNPAPIFDVNKLTEFRVTLRPADHAGENRNENRNEHELPGENRNENRNENRKLLEIISQYPGIQRKELAQRTGLSRGTLDRKLRELKSGNNPQIEHRGSNKTGGWFIKS